MKNSKNLLFALSLLLPAGPSPVMALEDVMDYDAIVEELKGSSKMSADDADPWSKALIHTSLGFATMFINVEPETGSGASGVLNGIEASFGIDLFTPAWKAEGALRSYNRAALDSNTSVALKEFDLRLMHASALTSKLRLEIGGGLAARYLSVASPFTTKSEYTTPASILALGLRSQVSKTVGLGIDVSLRNSLIDDSIDRSSVGGSFKINALF